MAIDADHIEDAVPFRWSSLHTDQRDGPGRIQPLHLRPCDAMFSSGLGGEALRLPVMTPICAPSRRILVNNAGWEQISRQAAERHRFVRAQIYNVAGSVCDLSNF
jgi:hypothetical protein